MESLARYLKHMASNQASDLFLTTGARPSVKIDGTLHPIQRQPLTHGQSKEIIYDVIDELQAAEFEQNLELNFGITLPEGRFRINVFQQRGEMSLVARFIKHDIPSLSQLNMPPILEKLTENKKGLVLVVGSTGSGKSTTLASMLNHRNKTQAGHILTIEDPIEYTFKHARSIVCQREVGVDTLSYDNALREALREAPDVIFIGEVRDNKTMEAALKFADTGHLCLTTLHAVNAYQALDRIVHLFPSPAHNQVLMDLSLNLNAIVSLRLLPGAEKTKRCAATEVMINSPYVSELVRSGDFHEIKNVMEKGNQEGMQTFDQSITELYNRGKITLETALSHADSRTDLEWKLNFGSESDSLSVNGQTADYDDEEIGFQTD
ncbi:MAG TPA: type IV pili twitching motility protein PilT [Gammaproteobacteria bacterium]|nr:type IV pili twitching motility protein PilT [Gammaproteobacteria bacterium]